MCEKLYQGVVVVSINSIFGSNVNSTLGDVMDPNKLATLQQLMSIGNDEFDKSAAEFIRSKAVETRTQAALAVQNANITDPKIQAWVFTGKFQ
jgi:hypothetical protein